MERDPELRRKILQILTIMDSEESDEVSDRSQFANLEK